MKTALSILLMLACNIAIIAQSDIRKQTICLISEIPILIESDPFIYAFDQNGNFKLGTGRIRIWNIGREQPVEFDHLVQMGKPLPIEKKKGLQMILSLDNKIIPINIKTSWHEKFLLLDTLITGRNKLTIKWKNQRNKIIQTIRFHCEPVSPIIVGIRQAKSVDSIDQIHKARQLKRINPLPEGFKSVSGNSILLDAGSHFELKLKTYSLLTDSSVLFRLSNGNENISQRWLTTGHVLTLPNLTSGLQYKLELKYAGQTLMNTYTLSIKPFWYQLWWVKMIIIIFLVVTAILMTGWYYRRKIKLISAQRQRLEEQLTTIQSQLNPHFIFNALSSIEGLVAGGQNKLANEYLSNFSMIMRETLKNADKLLISLKEEINLLEKYISIEQLRFGFKFSWQIDPSIPTEEVQVPPMLAQPLIENAVKHGASANGTLTLSITREQNNMLIKITNNKATNSSKLKTAGGYGWAFTLQRLKHFSALHPQTPIEFDFAEKETHFEATLRFINWFA
jgi:hypothetical protein